jgi:PAS domain S-box-containing protein
MKAQLLKVILVEDNFKEAALFKKVLSEARRVRFELTHTRRLEETIKLLEQDSFDLILLDLCLPDSQGLETVASVRAKAPLTPIVVLTDCDDEELAANAMRSGAQDYLIKAQVNSPLLVRVLCHAIERAQLWHKLRESEERYALAVNAGKVGVWDWKLETNEIYLDASLKAILGYAEDEIQNHLDSCCALIHPDDRETIEAAVNAHLEGLTPHLEIEHRMFHKDGSIRWVLLRGTAIRDSMGKPYRAIGTNTDITDRKQAQIALALQRQQVEQALERERQQLREIIANAPVAIAMFDAQMRCLVHSQKWAIDYGLEGQSIIGRTPCQIFSDIPHHWRAIVQRALNGEILSQMEDKWERADSSKLYLRWAVQPWFTSEGSIGGVAIATDRINELVEAREVALDNLRLKSEFLANVSHEIRTPMNGVLGMTELLAKTDLNSEQLDFVQTLRVSAENLLTLLNDILDFSKLEANEMRLEMQEFNLNRCVEDVADLFCTAAQSKGLELAVLIENNVPQQLVGDAHRLRQILLNLVGNSIKFTLAGEVVIQVSLEFETPTYVELRFSVTDTGIGIAPADQKKLFQAFSQVDSSTTRQHGGTGLGLAICQQLIKLMGGEIGVASQGAAFVPGRWSVKVASHQRRDKEREMGSVPPIEPRTRNKPSSSHPLTSRLRSATRSHPDGATLRYAVFMPKGQYIPLGDCTPMVTNLADTKLQSNIVDRKDKEDKEDKEDKREKVLCTNAASYESTRHRANVPSQQQGSTFWFTLPLAKQADALVTPPPVLELAGLRLLIVSGSTTIRKVVHSLASFWGMQVEEASSCAEAVTVWRSLESNNQFIDVAIFDLSLLERESESVRAALALVIQTNNSSEISEDWNPNTGITASGEADLPVSRRFEQPKRTTKWLLMSSVQERSLALRLMDLGFSGCITKPIKASKLLSSLRQVITLLGRHQQKQSAQPTQLDSRTSDPQNPAYRSKVKILLVEDTPTNQKVVLNQLKVLGYEADCVVNGKEALDRLTRRIGFAEIENWEQGKNGNVEDNPSFTPDLALGNLDEKHPATPWKLSRSQTEKASPMRGTSPPDSLTSCSPYNIVLMDCQMPVMDGYEATRHLRAFEGDSRRTVVIAMTAHALIGDREKCLAADMDDYISKPVTLEKLEEILERWIPQCFKEVESQIAEEPQLQIGQLRTARSQDLERLTPNNNHLSSPLKHYSLGNESCDEVPVDLARLSELADGDIEFRRELLEVFLEDAVVYLEELKHALEKEDYVTLSRRAHQLKGSSATVAIYKMPEIAAQLEHQADEKQLLGASELVTDLEQILEQVQAFIASR